MVAAEHQQPQPNGAGSTSGGPASDMGDATTRVASASLPSSVLLSSSKSNYALAVSHIVQELIRCYEKGEACNLTRLKGQACKQYGLKGIVRQADILQGLPLSYRKPLWPLLKTKPVRTAAGVAVVAVMSKPHRCPHIAYTGGVCVYCPGGLDSDFEYSTQAYTGYEPTSMRAIRARYDPYSQVKGRVHQLRAIGHTVDKVEFIVMGGTFLSLDKEYKDYFIRNLHDALSGHHSHSVQEAVRYSEQAVTKCIGITIGKSSENHALIGVALASSFGGFCVSIQRIPHLGNSRLFSFSCLFSYNL